MHNNNYQCKMCWNKALTFGVGSIKLSFVPLCSPNTCRDVFNSNVITFQSNCAECLHFSAFHFNTSASARIYHGVRVKALFCPSQISCMFHKQSMDVL